MLTLSKAGVTPFMFSKRLISGERKLISVALGLTRWHNNLPKEINEASKGLPNDLGGHKVDVGTTTPNHTITTCKVILLLYVLMKRKNSQRKLIQQWMCVQKTQQKVKPPLEFLPSC